MTEFLKFIEETKADSLLPEFSHGYLTHLTDAYKLREIINAGQVSPSLCPVFHEYLNYFFYSRPAFRVNNDGKATSSAAWYPCCLIFKEGQVIPKRIYPFDSGGFVKNMYHEYLHYKIMLDKMELRPDYNNLKELLSAFYNNHEGYFYAEPKKLDKDTLTLCYEAEGYYNMISAPNHDDIDDRCSAVEVQSAGAVQVSDLALLVVPSSERLKTEQSLLQKGISCQVVSYRQARKSRPIEYLSEIRNIVFNFFKPLS